MASHWHRNISTDVEKTHVTIHRRHRTWKHLHGRGEDGLTVRRRVSVAGNTSTDVKKTLRRNQSPARSKKHLHGRGEDLLRPFSWRPLWETPPRTWRRPIFKGIESVKDRNTSTDVEKTQTFSIRLLGKWKHLHGRGEDDITPSCRIDVSETPPRTWRRLSLTQACSAISGNTSTDVEKTTLKRILLWRTEKHLHGRGEDRLA